MRLKHYHRGETDIDQQENHATECLAACLVFSTKIRAAFLNLLVPAEVDVLAVAAEVDVVTQQSIEGGYIDLVLRQTPKFVAAVEVKVKSPENCDHHRTQLRNYKRWLNDENESAKYLFTLVRNKDDNFDPEKYGANKNGRRTWWELYKSLRRTLRSNQLSEMECSLIENFCGYLESEGIVSVYETEDLLRYAAGVKAQKAVSSIFNQIASRLRPEGFETSSIEDREDYWPELRIQHPRWSKIFGKGKNEKISLWFCVPGIWEAEKHAFFPDIELWHQLHGNDWRLAKSKLSKWLAGLHSRTFVWDVYEKGWNASRQNLAASDIQTEPKRIVAERGKDVITLNPDELPDEDDLINELVNLIKQYAAIVDSLGS